MPSFFGGGPEPALKEFRRAQSLFAPTASTAPTTPNWGSDDAYLWAGRAQMKLGDYEGAKKSYEQALQANPNNGWVRTSLLPEAEKSMASAQETAK
jgi:tetratricopeptide (TPR) repeat protein